MKYIATSSFVIYEKSFDYIYVCLGFFHGNQEKKVKQNVIIQWLILNLSGFESECYCSDTETP